MKYGSYIEHYYRYKTTYSHYRHSVLRYYTKLCHSRRNNSSILYPKQVCVVTAMRFYTCRKLDAEAEKYVTTAA